MNFDSPSISLPANNGMTPALGANVLVLNKFYQAIRVINVRRAFSLLCRDLAEVIHMEPVASGESRWQNLNFSGWQELSQFKAEFEPDGYDWIHTVRLQLAVPRVYVGDQTATPTRQCDGMLGPICLDEGTTPSAPRKRLADAQRRAGLWAGDTGAVAGTVLWIKYAPDA